MNTNTSIAASELIINPDGSIYHLDLLPSEVAETIITVGDQHRVEMVSQHFDKIEVRKAKREFHTHTGTYKGKRISVISTGIGTDNIDIVFNELDALFNVDFQTRMVKEQLTSLDIIRIGTSGAMQEGIPVDSHLASAFGLGLDSLMHYYELNYNEAEQALINATPTLPNQLRPYAIQSSERLLQNIAGDLKKGITVTCPGFYAPQGRQVRLKAANENLLDEFRTLNVAGYRATNFEMETAGIYGMAKALGHHPLSLNAILANRVKGTFSKTPKKTVADLIVYALEKIIE